MGSSKISRSSSNDSLRVSFNSLDCGRERGLTMLNVGEDGGVLAPKSTDAVRHFEHSKLA